VLEDGLVPAVVCAAWGGLTMHALLMCLAELSSAVPFSGGSE
jgi:amino acid transporter